MVIMYFGSPGCGKTTSAVRSMLKNKCPCYANFDQKLCPQIESSYLGKFGFADCDLYIDESGIDFNSRAYKSMQQKTISYLKLHRHYNTNIYLYSQSWEDTDVTFRRLVDRLYYLRKLGPFTIQYRVSKRVTVDDNTHQIIDGYHKSRFLFGLICGDVKIFLRRPYYKYFDSFDKSKCVLPAYPIAPDLYVKRRKRKSKH